MINEQTKKDKMTMIWKTLHIYWATRTPQKGTIKKAGINAGAPETKAVPSPLVAPILLLV